MLLFRDILLCIIRLNLSINIQWLHSSDTNSLFPDATFNLCVAIPVGLVRIMSTPSDLFYSPYAQNICNSSFINDLSYLSESILQMASEFHNGIYTSHNFSNYFSFEIQTQNMVGRKGFNLFTIWIHI